MITSEKLYSYDYLQVKTYLIAVIFIAGNLLLPHLLHFVPYGGPTLLPIYFFTLIAAYKYGLRVGLLTALLSPVLNSLIFGMPIVAFLPIILIKSSLLALIAAMAAKYVGKINIIAILLVVITYQLIGTAFEWMIVKDFAVAIQDLKIGYPGMLLQVFGGYLVLKSISKL